MSESARREWERAVIEWTREQLDDADHCGETQEWDDLVWWGLWKQCGGECSTEPDMIFPSKKLAEAMGEVMGLMYDWAVMPVVLKIEARDSFDYPEEPKDAPRQA